VAEKAEPVIQEISWRPFGLVIKASAPLNPEIFTLDAPYRFVVDLPAAEFAEPGMARTITPGSGPVSQVRLAQKGSGAVRIVVDCPSPTGLQLIQLGDRSTLVVALAGQRHSELAAILQKRNGYEGGGQEIETVWARETATELKVHLRAAGKLTYSLDEHQPGRLKLKVPAGHLSSLLPKPGRHLAAIAAKTGTDGWTMEVGLKDGMYQLSESLTPDKTGLTLTWTQVRPRQFADRPLVIIDPGHGGSDPGAVGPGGITEKSVCLELAHALQRALWKKRYNAVLTRSADTDLLLAPRLAMIDKLNAELFISLHANSHTGPESFGTETYFRNAHSQDFAAVVQEQITALMNRPNRGVKQERLYVIRHAKVPSILVETGFISNPIEEKLLGAPAFQAEAAAAISAGVERYLAGVLPIGLETIKDVTGLAAPKDAPHTM
jgi:N-acetylmuramoyl-L-alanine amidase